MHQILRSNSFSLAETLVVGQKSLATMSSTTIMLNCRCSRPPTGALCSGQESWGMKLSQPQAQVFIPIASVPQAEALRRTTHLGVGAHPDDLEFFGWHPILQCFEDRSLWYTGVVASDGRSSP